jgi:hypothetical protein
MRLKISGGQLRHLSEIPTWLPLLSRQQEEMEK